MEDFIASKKYNCIVLRYAIGYLSDEKLVRFLTNCRVWLTENSTPSQRTCTRESFIIVQDQVLSEDETEWEEYNQRIRRNSSIEKIFVRALLDCYKQIGPESLCSKYDSVKMWALYPKNSNNN